MNTIRQTVKIQAASSNSIDFQTSFTMAVVSAKSYISSGTACSRRRSPLSHGALPAAASSNGDRSTAAGIDILEPPEGHDDDDDDDTADSDAAIAITIHRNDTTPIVDQLCAGLERVFCTKKYNKPTKIDDDKRGNPKLTVSLHLINAESSSPGPRTT